MIDEIKAERLFEDNESKEVYYMRLARIGSPGTPLSQFRRLNELAGYWQPGDIKELICSAQYITDNFDATGLGKNLRKGWARCNGQNGTYNFGQKISIGYDPTVTAFDLPGKIVGANEQKIEKQNLPAIKIDVPVPPSATSQDTSGAGRIVLGDGANDATGGPTLKTANLGDGTALNIMQASVVTLKIMKL